MARRPADNKQLQTASTRKETADPPRPRRFYSKLAFCFAVAETLNLKVGMRSADNKQQTAWGHAHFMVKKTKKTRAFPP
jgi:hypothetical protein